MLQFYDLLFTNIYDENYALLDGAAAPSPLILYQKESSPADVNV
jgi:hypothetical protein